MKTETITVRITETQKLQLIKTGIKTSAIIRQLIDNHTCNVDTVKNS
jgi:hypothetical protein